MSAVATHPALHCWPRSPAAAIALQEKLARHVQLRPLLDAPRWCAGVDVAFPRRSTGDGSTWALAGAVLWDAQTGEVVDAAVARRVCRFPYVPGLLSFRELPAMLAALRKLSRAPDVILCDAAGVAHPRSCGLASHLGLWLGCPTVGCAKSRLCGTHQQPGPLRGDHAPLLLADATVGCVLRTRAHVRPLFVSPGHLCDVGAAREVTLRCTTRYRLPEPTRLAHRLVSEEASRVSARTKQARSR